MSATPETTMNTVMIFKAIVRSVSVFGVWGWVDIVGASILLVGCIGELWLLLNKLPEHNERRASLTGCWVFLDRSESIIRLIGVRLKIIRPRKFSDLKEHLLEVFFISLVAIGVGMEMCSLPFSLNEVATSNDLAGQANERAAIVESNNVALEAEIQPRSIKPKQKQEIANELRQKLRYPVNGRVKVVAEIYDSESRIYAKQIVDALNGGKVFAVIDINSLNVQREIDFGIKYLVPSNPQYEVRSIAQALKSGGVVPTEVETNFDEKGVLFEIWVGAKPFESGLCTSQKSA